MFLIDILRVLVSIQMVNGHTLDALLLPTLRQGAFYEDYTWFRGLISTSFLLIAGMSYYLATLCRFDAHKANPDAVRKRFRRGAELIIIGHLLNFPYAVFDTQALAGAAVLKFLSCDILQCIGLTLIFLELLTLISNRAQQVVWSAAILSFCIWAFGPLLDRLEFSGFGAGLNAYLTHRSGSPFPWLPWAMYVFLGITIARFIWPQGSQTPKSRVWGRSMMIAALNYVLFEWMRSELGWFEDINTHPSVVQRNVLNRLRGVLFALPVLVGLTYRLTSLPDWIQGVAKNSLFIYWFHLVLLFHPPVWLASRLGYRQLSLGASIVASLVMIVGVISCSIVWSIWKEKKGGFAGLLGGLYRALIYRPISTS